MNIPTKPADVTFTDEQWRAIWATGTDTLVSAAAGSGKTKVLITRMIEKVLNEQQPIDVDQLLVLTFTNAAAAEMRHRMAAALEEAIQQQPTAQHLRRQLSLLNKAHISTLHSFCLTVVRQYAYLLDIDPGFRIADQTEAALLREDVLADVLEKAYQAEDPEPIYRLADSFTSDRNDQSLETLMTKLYHYARVHPLPEQWLRMIPQQYQIAEDLTIDELPFIAPLKTAILHSLEEAVAMLEEMKRLAEMPDGPTPLLETARADLLWVREAMHKIAEGSWSDAYEYFQTLVWVKAGTIRKNSCDEELAKRAKTIRDTVKKNVSKVKESYFVRKPARLLEEMRKMAPLMSTLVELVQAFSEQYEQVKIDRGIVDFSDLEHYALRILSDGLDDQGRLKPSEVAEAYRNRFEEVLVDEYQDTNVLQEAIIQLVKRGTEADGNLFMVGDVKQSIYRFRLAEPHLFLSKYRQFTVDGQEQGLKIDLNANFRSRPEVLFATNFIFSQVMGERVGEINYDEAASLKYGANYTQKSLPVQLTFMYEDEEETLEAAHDAIAQTSASASTAQVEARYIAHQIQRLMNEGAEVTDAFRDERRPLAYRDIVILMRSMTWTGEMVETFKRAGIPVYAEVSTGYFQSIEVMTMLNTLKVIDNPYQDIPLAAVLRSPFIGLTEPELAQIRLADRKRSFYEALQTFVQSGGAGIAPVTQQKLQRFFILLEEWRNLARRGSLADLIWQVYQDTYYYEMVGAMSNGKQRQANLRALHDRAIAYEKTSFRGLFRFLRFVDRLQKRGEDLGEARFVSETEDVVRIMTIHASKGLEFPYVFLAGLGRQFNKMDFHEPYLFDQQFGLAVKAIDPDHRITYTSLPYLAMKEQKELEMRAEEMRVLYVAMTRAKERLELVASVKDLEKELNTWQEAQLIPPTRRLPPYMRSRANRYIDWIGPAIARHKSFEPFGQVTGGMFIEDDAQFDIQTYPRSMWLQQNVESEEDDLHSSEDKQQIKQIDEAMLEEIRQRFDVHYPYEVAVRQRSKQSVSELKRMALLEQANEEPFLFSNSTDVHSPYLHDRPQFMQKNTLTAAEVGTAMHTVMQQIDLRDTHDLASVEQLVAHLLARQLLTKEEATAVDVQAIVRFFQSSIGKRLTTTPRVFRELPFTYALPSTQTDQQILQGMIDCLFEEADGWVLLDYKTDRTKGRFISERELHVTMQNRYGVQLSLYKRAMEDILQIHIKEMLLYLFDEEREMHIQEEFI